MSEVGKSENENENEKNENDGWKGNGKDKNNHKNGFQNKNRSKNDGESNVLPLLDRPLSRTIASVYGRGRPKVDDEPQQCHPARHIQLV